MSEILDVARFEGAGLCFRTGYLCAVLHLYNALRSLVEPIASRPLLERLRHACRESLFLGTLPTGNFSSHYRRATGKGFGRNQETGRVDYRTLSMNSRNERKLPSMHLCLFIEHHNNCYQTDESSRIRVYSTSATPPPSRSQRQPVIDEVHSSTFNVALERIKVAMPISLLGQRFTLSL